MGNNYIKNLFKRKIKTNALSENGGKISDKIIKHYNNTRQEQNREFVCNAPFTSLRFDLKGQVVVCCYNKTHVLEKYPFDSIKSIWEGSKIAALRKNIEEEKLDLGCQICREQIINGYFSSVKTKLYDDLKPNKDFPILLEFELDNTCNLECIMCNGDASSKIYEKEHSNPVRKKIYNSAFVETIKPYLANIQRANFIGGEPLLIPIYYEIVNEILAVNPEAIIHFSTNGTILNDRIKSLFESGRFDISLSIDSVNKQTYEKIRKNALFETTFTNLKYFHDYSIRKNTSFCIWVCPLTVNRYEIPEIFNYFNKMNISVYLNNVMDPQNLRIANLDIEELKDLRQYYESFVFINDSIIANENYSRYIDFVNQIAEFIEDKKKTLEFLKDYNEIEPIRSFLFSKFEPYLINEDSLSLKDLIIEKDELVEKLNEIFNVFKEIESLHEIMVSFNYFSVEEIVVFFKENSKENICKYLKNKVVSVKM